MQVPRELAGPTQASGFREVAEQFPRLVLHSGQSLPSAGPMSSPKAVRPGNVRSEGFAHPVADAGVPLRQLARGAGPETGEDDEQGGCAHRPVVEAHRRPSPARPAGPKEDTQQVGAFRGTFGRVLARIVGGHGFFTAPSGLSAYLTGSIR